MPVNEGYIYFAYDTGKIYLDKAGGRYLMSNGGNSDSSTGLIWAHGTEETITKATDDDADQTYII